MPRLDYVISQSVISTYRTIKLCDLYLCLTVNIYLTGVMQFSSAFQYLTELFIGRLV